MDNALARHSIDERNRLSQRRCGTGQVVAVNRSADGLQGATQAGAELAIMLAIFSTLPMRFQRGCMLSHVINYLRNPKS